MNHYSFAKDKTPCYIYDQKQIEQQCRLLKETLSGFEFLYSLKSNPFPPVVDCIAKQGFSADAASAEEVLLALESGMKAEDIYYSTPGKTDKDITDTYERCVLIADSFWDLKRFQTEAAKRGEIHKIGVRINPDFSMKSKQGASSKFGIDMEQMNDLKSILDQCPNLSVDGIHIHIRSQVLDTELLGSYYQRCFQLAECIAELNKGHLGFINFGSGIGTLYDCSRDKAVNLEKLAQLTQNILEQNNHSLKARLLIEVGRFLVCNAGTYYSSIVDIKISHGKKYLIVENGMNGFFRPALAILLNKNAASRDIPGQEPLYTCKNAFEFTVLNHLQEKEMVTIVGSLCTALDVMAEDVMLNKTQIGDIIAVSNAGSYAYTLSPLMFSSHDLPGQYLL